ncbi:MAG: hypothetical protein Q9174_003063 [Haloplaca sp. 1 TL-2023]
MAHNNAVHSNFGVDYVVTYRFTDTNNVEARDGFTNLMQALYRVGLATEVRNGDNCALLVFVKVGNDKRFAQEVYRSRVKDWLHGVRAAEPARETQNTLAGESLNEAERFRVIHHLITSPREEGGAGITPKEGQWKNVESIFPLHDHTFNKEWIKKWSTMTFLKAEDFDQIRDRFGEKIAYYFAFTQSYFQFLIFPAAFGFASWVILGSFSPIYGIVNGLWCVTFVEYWKRQEIDLGVRWGVKGVACIQRKRREFQHEKEVRDPVTGETIQVFPATKRLSRQLLQVPFAFLAVLALGTLIATCFGIEIFLSEVYNGPGQTLLVFLPTGILTTLVPTLTSVLTSVATRLNDYENWETSENYQSALTQKIFVLNFITSYLPIFLTAFVYVPFGSLIVPYLDIFSLTAKPFAQNEKQLQTPDTAGFVINPSRLRKQVIYFTVTAQIVNFALETIMPYVKRRGFSKYQEMKSERAAKKGGAGSGVTIEDQPEEADFLKRVRKEAELDVYDVATDLREMVVQFGYLALFSVVWPLTPVSFLVNNWIELRSDAVKICVEMQRPTPGRADSIGPWLDSLQFLTWLGSITTAALAYLFSNDGMGPDGTPATIKGWALLLTIFFSEHVYLMVRWGVGLAISKIDSPGMEKERGERFTVRKRYLQDALGHDVLDVPAHAEEKITRESLEEDARQSTLRKMGPQEHFWSRQRSWEESAKVGANLIEKMAPKEGKKQQ